MGSVTQLSVARQDKDNRLELSLTCLMPRTCMETEGSFLGGNAGNAMRAEYSDVWLFLFFENLNGFTALRHHGIEIERYCQCRIGILLNVI